MRILKGNFKGRNIVAAQNIRPVSLRVRKACFDILQEEVVDKSVLDLFAGSGALGIEALSCGAQDVVFIDIKKGSIHAINRNLTSLKLRPKATVYLKDAFGAVKDFHARKAKFGLVFLDPPYYKGMLKKALQTLDKYDILARSGYIVGFCYSKDDFVEQYHNFCLILKKKYGQSLILIYKKS